MSFWDQLRRILLFFRPVERSFHLDGDLMESLQMLAEREQRTEEEVATVLLSKALAQRERAEALWQVWEGLSWREQQVVALTCLNYTNRQIAASLRLSPETIKSHVRRALHKYGAESKVELRQMLLGWDFSAWREDDDA